MPQAQLRMHAFKRQLATTVLASYSTTTMIGGSIRNRLPFGYLLAILSGIVCASRHQSKFFSFTLILISVFKISRQPSHPTPTFPFATPTFH